MQEVFVSLSRVLSSLSRVVWAELGNALRNRSSQALSLWFAQDTCAAQVWADALAENRGDDRTFLMDRMTFQERF